MGISMGRWAGVAAGVVWAVVGGGCHLESAYWSPEQRELTTPAGYRDVRVDVGGGEWVHGWFVPSADLAQGRVERAPLLIFCHGRATTIDALTPYVLPAARRAGASLLIFAYRGFGASSPLEHVTRAGVVSDTRAVVDHAMEMECVEPGAVFVMGYSLGAVPALAAASRDQRVAGAVVGGGYGRAADALQDRGRGWAAWLIGGAFDPADSARGMAGRGVYIFHGGADGAVGPYHAYVIAEAAARAGADLTVDVVPGASHYSVITDGEALMERIGDWIKARAARPRRQ